MCSPASAPSRATAQKLAPRPSERGPLGWARGLLPAPWLHTLKVASTPTHWGPQPVISYDCDRRLKAPGTIAISG